MHNFHEYLGVHPKFRKIEVCSSFSAFPLTTLMYINKKWADPFPISKSYRLVPTKLQQLAQFDSLTEPEDDSSFTKSLLVDKLV